jgi:hypothetical protein
VSRAPEHADGVGGHRDGDRPASGVRGEHTLRLALKDMTERHARLLRAATAAHRYAYGRRDPDDLRDLRRALAAAGFDAPPRPSDDGDE